MKNDRNFLRKALKANAIFSSASGVLFAAFYRQVGRYIGIEPLLLILATGLLLVAFSVFVWYVSTTEPIKPLAVWAIIVSDISWVAGTAYFIYIDVFSYTGIWVMGLLSLGVLDFAVAQYIGLRKSIPKTETA